MYAYMLTCNGKAVQRDIKRGLSTRDCLARKRGAVMYFKVAALGGFILAATYISSDIAERLLTKCNMTKLNHEQRTAADTRDSAQYIIRVHSIHQNDEAKVRLIRLRKINPKQDIKARRTDLFP